MTQAIRAVQGQYLHQQIRETERSIAEEFSFMKCFVISHVLGGKKALGAEPRMIYAHARKSLTHFNKIP